MATILVVDDAETIRGSIRKTLEESGHTVLEGCDGAEGLHTVSQRDDINLVILDINMPRLGGIPLATEIRKNVAFDSVPIIAISTERGPELRTAGKQAGIDLWLIKPLLFASLPILVQEALDRRLKLASLRQRQIHPTQE